MTFLHLAFLLTVLGFSVRIAQSNSCFTRTARIGEISDSFHTWYSLTKCWRIYVPENTSIQINVTKLSIKSDWFLERPCLRIKVSETEETFSYENISTTESIRAFHDVTITLSFKVYKDFRAIGSLSLNYRIEDRMCIEKDHFRCSDFQCIPLSKKCDGVEDCENGLDEAECEDRMCIEKDHFRCSDFQCIPLSKKCDGVEDCENGLDEAGCEYQMCMGKDHFRCFDFHCIPLSKECDGVVDCENGLDEAGCGKGVLSVKGINASRDNMISWLKDQRYVGWGRNAHRAITALYLAQDLSFRGHNAEEELIAKQLELQTVVALLRNSTDPLSVSELSMFLNALSVTCHDPRRFYGYDLVKILGERLSAAKSPIPGAYVTLCNTNWTLSESDINSLLHLLRKPSKYPFLLDVQAVTVMALTCLKNLRGKEFGEVLNASNIYDAAVEKFIAGQLSDGSYGNVYTTSLVAQALIASGQENNPKWNYTHTVKYLMKQLNSSSVDFLSAYLALPVFSGRSLVDIASVDCRNISRKQDEDTEISDVTNKIGNKIRVQYSLYVGDQKDVIHTIYLRVPERSSVYDIMRVAQAVDPKYKFSHRDVSGHMYVYEIAGVINDPEAGKFWLMYSEKSNKTIEHYTESPDKLILYDAIHLIMWYKTAHI